MASSPRNPRAWAQAKISALKERGLWTGNLQESQKKNWDARVAQRAAQIYKDRGHSWDVSAPSASSGLRSWTDAQWGYALGDRSGRYLPLGVRQSMSRAELLAENARKRACTSAGVKRCPYGPALLSAFRAWRERSA